MSDLLTQTNQAAPATDALPGYITVTGDDDGVPISFTFYQGFVSKLTWTGTNTGRVSTVYTQSGVFRTPDGGPPLDRCTLRIRGGQDALDIEIEIDDSPRPAPDFRGPIKRFDVKTKKSGGSGSSGRVKTVKGASQVARVDVEMNGAAGDKVHPGGVRAHQGGGGTGVDNNAQTCPPTC